MEEETKVASKKPASKKLKHIKNAYKIIRTYIISLFDRDITFYASSLSFYTLFTLVPVMLIVLSISTSLTSFNALSTT